MFVIPPGELSQEIKGLFPKATEEISSIRKPIKVWLMKLSDIEESCFIQAIRLANLPFLHSHVAIMPDTHMGYGMPIGGVIVVDGVVIPNGVGVDICCGLIAARLSGITMDEIMPRREEIVHQILRAIPTGFHHRKKPLVNSKTLHDNLIERVRYQKSAPMTMSGSNPVFNEQLDRIPYQLGTLGGGNHFIEIQKDENNQPWIMIHSGSRNFGKQVADYYNKAAEVLNERYYSQVPSKWELAFLPRGEELFDMYWREMYLALEFALWNRNCILEETTKAIESLFDRYIKQEEYINIHHNYASLENHKGRNVIVHRKGATLARENTIGIIPGSMGTRSYIVKGKGSADSFHSCSHGSGRAMGRKEAKRKFTVEQVVEYYKKLDIVIGKAKKGDIAEECDWAYKDVKEVMTNQEDLVDIVHELTPVAVVKG